MTALHSVRAILTLLLSAAVLAGCGEKGAQRYHLSGNVKYAGQPVPKGIIYFDPDLGAGVDGPQGFAPIENGKYDTRQGGLGHGGGKVVCRLFAGDGKVVGEATLGKLLFPEYTFKAELPAADGTRDFDIAKDAPFQPQP